MFAQLGKPTGGLLIVSCDNDEKPVDETQLAFNVFTKFKKVLFNSIKLKLIKSSSKGYRMKGIEPKTGTST